jgi:hypothetical protein
VQGVDKARIKHPVVVVFFLRPWIREQDKIRVDGSWWNQIADRVVSFDPHQADIVEPPSPGLAVDLPDPAQHPVDPEKIHVRVRRRPGQ